MESSFGASYGPPQPIRTATITYWVFFVIQALLSFLAVPMIVAMMREQGATAGDATIGAGVMFVAMAVSLIIGAALAGLVTWGLFKGQSWAWYLALIGAALGLLNIPIGTVVSAFILYLLTRPEAKAYVGV